MFVGPDRTLHTDKDVAQFARTRVKAAVTGSGSHQCSARLTR